MEQNLIVDLSQLSVIKPSILNRFCKIAEQCISDYVLEAKLNDEDVISIDIGIGKLDLVIDNSELKYYFIPSKRLENFIVEAYQNDESVLNKSIEEGLENRLLSAYKELF